jgi:alanine racemase
MRPTRAIIHLDNLKANIAYVRRVVGDDVAICLPVKADGYGQGAVQAAKAAVEAGVNWLAVASLEEGAELRQAGLKAPVVVLSAIVPEDAGQALKLGLSLFAGNRQYIEQIVGQINQGGHAQHEPCGVFLKVDTGMGRLGCRPEETVELARLIHSYASLEYKGTATHLACSDTQQEADIAYTREQIARFRTALDAIKAAGMKAGIATAANSGAVLYHKDAFFDMVRPGILCYGYGSPEVRPVMELESAVSNVKEIKAGDSVSYGRIWTAKQDTCIAIVPVGYADGLRRDLSGKFSIIIDGKAYPQVGRICMDCCMVDLGPGSRVKRGAKATIFGGEAPDAGVLAEKIGTIPYEITCGISKRVPRVYTK